MSKNDEIIIKPEYSAVGAKNHDKPSRAVQSAIETFKQEDLNRIVEVGCGLLANTPHILNAFPFVVLLDTKNQYQRIKNKLSELSGKYSSFNEFIDTDSFQRNRLQLDGALIINVLHILPEIHERIELLKGVYRNLRKKGFIFIDVPRNETFYRNSVKTAKSYNDGYIMRRGGYYTFYVNIRFEELKGYAEEAGFQFVQRLYLNHRVTFICQK